MKNIDIEKIKEIALKLADKHYPGTECVILTGSQLEADYVTPQSDIDILLIGTQFTSVTSDGVLDEDYKVDFTRIAYNDLQNILIEESYSYSASILNMIANGKVLRDTNGIFELLQEHAKTLYKKGNNNYDNERWNIRRGLSKLKKHFSKDLDETYNLFMLCDFVQLISGAYLFVKNDGWTACDGYRKVKMISIKEKDSPFLQSMAKFIKDYFTDSKLNKEIVLNYIDKFLNYPVTKNTSKHVDKRFIVSVNFEFQNHSYFFKYIYKSIFEHDYLSKYFLYGQVNNNNNIFKNKYTLVFDNKKTDFDETTILRELHTLFDCENKKILNLNIVNPEYIYSQFEDEKVYDALEKLFSCLSKEMNKIVDSDTKFVHKHLFILNLIISMIIIKSLKISPTQAKHICNCLLKKWRPMTLNVDRKHLELSEKNNEYERYVQYFYSINEDIIDEVNQKFASDEMNLQFYDIDFSETINLCENISTTIDKSKKSLSPLFVKSMLPLNTRYENKDMIKSYYLGLSFDMLINIMGVNNDSRGNLAYILAEMCAKQEKINS